MRKLLFILVVLVFVLAGCASAPKKEKEIKPEKKTEEAQSSEDKYEKMLDEGEKLLRAGKVKDAVEKHIDPVISYYENEYKDSPKDIYCARDKTEMMTYLMMAAVAKKATIVLSSTWAEALFYRAYILVEFKKYEEAKTVLEKALKLSPYT